MLKDNDLIQITDGNNPNNFRAVKLKELKEYLKPKKSVKKESKKK